MVSAGAGIFDAFSGGDDDAKDILRAQENNLQFAGNVAKAIADPNSQLFQDLVAQEEEAARQSFIQGIDQLLIEHERARARGAPGYLLSDRRDEALAKAVGQQRELGTIQARNTARETLKNAASAAGVGLGAAPSTIQVAQQVEQADANRRAGGFDLINEALRTVGQTDFSKLFRGDEPDLRSPATGSTVRIG